MSIKEFLIILLVIYLIQPEAPSPPASQSAVERIHQLACTSALVSQSNTCKVEKSAQITVGFSCMLDYKTRLSRLTGTLKAPSVAKYHSSIESEEDLLETIAYLFENGSAGEFRIPEQLFSKILQDFDSLEKEVVGGGNAGAIARRLIWEGIDVEMVCPISDEILPFLKGSSILSPHLKGNDIHLIIEYEEGEKWGNFKAYRSNRFYMNADTLNTDKNVLEAYKKSSDSAAVVVVGGIQLIQGLDHYKEFIKKLTEIYQVLHDKNKKIHLELGDIHDNPFYKEISGITFDSDSLGMNEQEMGKLLAVMNNEKFRGYEAKAEVSKVLEDLNQLLRQLQQKKYRISRVHLHTISLQVICSKAIWSDPTLPAARASVLANQFSCNSTSIQYDRTNLYKGKFDLGDLKFEFDESNVHRTWSVDEFQCAAVLVPTCRRVVHVTSLGDSLTAIGLAFQTIIN